MHPPKDSSFAAHPTGLAGDLRVPADTRILVANHHTFRVGDVCLAVSVQKHSRCSAEDYICRARGRLAAELRRGATAPLPYKEVSILLITNAKTAAYSFRPLVCELIPGFFGASVPSGGVEAGRSRAAPNHSRDHRELCFGKKAA